MATIREAESVAAIVRDAGGRIVGRTRLQKVAFILEAAGLGSGFRFKYKHYGPYSEELSEAAGIAGILDFLREVEQPASWGGTYSIYTTATSRDSHASNSRVQIAEESSKADAVELELAATALFLACEGMQDPWRETARRKPDKADSGRLDRAQKLYERLRRIDAPRPLPCL
jgi:uncharacterized protein YwgA